MKMTRVCVSVYDELEVLIQFSCHGFQFDSCSSVMFLSYLMIFWFKPSFMSCL